MKASVFGIPDFPFGKKALPDERLEKMKELYRAAKVTSLQVEYVPEKDLKVADAIVCPKDRLLDLIILDMEVLEARAAKQLTEPERQTLARAQELLEKEVLLKDGSFTDDEKKWLMNNNLVTIRPMALIDRAEIDDLPSLTRRVYVEAGRICFLTGGPKEARAWEIRRGANAVDAAGAIHSDIARGFIRAEVMGFDELVKIGNVNQAKSSCLRQENKEYIIKDGDVIEFNFSV